MGHYCCKYGWQFRLVSLSKQCLVMTCYHSLLICVYFKVYCIWVQWSPVYLIMTYTTCLWSSSTTIIFAFYLLNSSISGASSIWLWSNLNCYIKILKEKKEGRKKWRKKKMKGEKVRGKREAWYSSCVCELHWICSFCIKITLAWSTSQNCKT